MKNASPPHSQSRRTLIKAAASVAATGPLMWPTLAHAAWPERPITMIVPYAAGGGTDAVGRAIAVSLEKELGRPVNVVNRGGGNAVVGHSAIASAKPDGYTIGLMSSEIAMLHWLGLTKLTHRDFSPMAVVNAEYAAINVAKDGKFTDLKQMLDAIRTSPAGTFKASGTGTGASWHVALNGLLIEQGIDPAKVRWVPSQGAAPAMVELAAGGIDIVPCSVPEARSMIDAGKAKGLTILGPQRHAIYKDIPSLPDAIGSNYTFAAWRSIAGPKGLDPAVQKRLAEALDASYKSAFYQEFLTKQGFGPEWVAGDALTPYVEKYDMAMGKTLDVMGLKK